MLLHGGVVNAQELVGGGHHVDAIRLTLGTFPVHELVRRGINTRKSHQCLLEWKRRTSPISAMSWEPRAGPTPNIPITTEYSGNDAARYRISFRSAAKAAEAVWS